MKNWRPPEWNVEEIVEDALLPLGEPDKDKVKRALFRLVEAGADAILKARKPIEEEIFQALQGMVCQHCFDWRTGKYKDKGLSVNTIAIRIYRKYKVELGLDD